VTLPEIERAFAAAQKEMRGAAAKKEWGLAQMQWERMGRLRHTLSGGKMTPTRKTALKKVDAEIKSLEPLARKIVI
jgi:hypothetical protein